MVDVEDLVGEATRLYKMSREDAVTHLLQYGGTPRTFRQAAGAMVQRYGASYFAAFLTAGHLLHAARAVEDRTGQCPTSRRAAHDGARRPPARVCRVPRRRRCGVAAVR
jgi:hypothetical protein